MSVQKSSSSTYSSIATLASYSSSSNYSSTECTLRVHKQKQLLYVLYVRYHRMRHVHFQGLKLKTGRMTETSVGNLLYSSFCTPYSTGQYPYDTVIPVGNSYSTVVLYSITSAHSNKSNRTVQLMKALYKMLYNRTEGDPVHSIRIDEFLFVKIQYWTSSAHPLLCSKEHTGPHHFPSSTPNQSSSS